MALVFLCGQKDCGKTYFLNLLRTEKKVYGFDLDEEILKETGSSDIRELYAELGNQEFRRTEKKVFKKLLSNISVKNAIIALGGGSVDLLEEAASFGTTVYLYQLPDILFSRMEKEGLPAFVKDRESFIGLFNERNRIYMQKCNKMIKLFQTEEKEVCQTLLEIYSN